MQVNEPFRRLQPALAQFAESGDLQLVCEFTGSAYRTVQGWVANKRPVKGEREIRLWHLLLAVGFEFPELRIDAYNHYLAELFAYSIVTMDEVQQLCEVKNPQTALQILRGQPPMHPAMSLEQLQEMYDEQLSEAKAVLSRRLEVEAAQALPALPPAVEEVQLEVPTFDQVPVLAKLLQAILPLTEQALAAWSPEQRAHLRELVGGEGMFALSNNVNALCSERTRTQQGRR